MLRGLVQVKNEAGAKFGRALIFLDKVDQE